MIRARVAACCGALLVAIVAQAAHAGQDEHGLRVGSGPAALLKGKFPVRLIAYANGNISKLAARFRWQDPTHPALGELRTRERLDQVISHCDSHFEKILALKGWTGAQWKFGTPEPYPPWNALVILDAVRGGKHGGWCGQYAQVFLQALLSVGYRARYVEIGPRDNPYGHFTTEVWLPDHGKWAVVDATPLEDSDCYFVDRRNVPLSALELHLALVGGKADEVRAVRADPLSPDVPPVSPAKIDVYYYLRYLWRTDQLSDNPPVVDLEHVFDRWHDAYEWEDERTVMWEDSPFAASWEGNERQTAVRISRDQDVDWPVSDAVRMELRPMVHKDGMFALGLWACQPNLAGFLVKIDDGQWAEPQATEQARKRDPWEPAFCPVRLDPGRHTIRARAKRTTGELGPVSFVTFEFATAAPAR